MNRILARLTPSGELRVRLKSFPKGKKTAKDARVIPLNPMQDEELGLAYLDYMREFQESDELKDALKTESGNRVRPGWGAPVNHTRFGARAKRTILDAGGVLDRENLRSCAITLTLPGSGSAAYQAMSDYSGYIANRLKTWLYDNCQSDIAFSYFYCWERQKRGALHLHFCVSFQKFKTYRKIERNVKDAWISILESVEERAGVPMFMSPKGFDWRRKKSKIQVDVQKVRKSVSAYFSKYCSKDSSKSIGIGQNSYAPSRWWGCSRNLKRKINEWTEVAISSNYGSAQYNEVIEKVYDKCELLGEVYLNYDKYRDRVYLIAFPGYEAGKEIIRGLSDDFDKYDRCTYIEGGMNNRERRRRIGRIRRRWNTTAERLRLAEIIGTDSPEWEILVGLLTGARDTPNDVIDDILDIIQREGCRQQEQAESEGRFFIQLDLNTDGL